MTPTPMKISSAHMLLPIAGPVRYLAFMLAWILLAALIVLPLAGCNLKYAEGQFLEQEKRWEEASIAYHLALLEEPGNPEIQGALSRANKIVARENFDHYRRFLARKEFRKAYARLQDASRQDPEFEPVQAELDKWMRVLLGGQVRFDFEASQSEISQADEIKLTIRFNTPNPGETVDAEIDINTGTFHAEDLLYDRPDALLTYYTINSIGVQLIYGRSRIKKFTSREYVRFINIRTPILQDINGQLSVKNNPDLIPVASHRERLDSETETGRAVFPKANPTYSITLRGDRILVSSPEPWSGYTPRFLYINKRDQRLFVDFGRYEVKLPEKGNRWSLKRLPLGKSDYFPNFSRNIALQPYFFYREGVYVFLKSNQG